VFPDGPVVCPGQAKVNRSPAPQATAPGPGAVGRRPKSASSNPEHRVIALSGGKLECRRDVFSLQVRISFKDLGLSRPGRQQVENVLNAHAQPTDTGTPSALLGADGDAMQLAQALVHLDLSVPDTEGRSARSSAASGVWRVGGGRNDNPPGLRPPPLLRGEGGD